MGGPFGKPSGGLKGFLNTNSESKGCFRKKSILAAALFAGQTALFSGQTALFPDRVFWVKKV